MFRLDTIKDFIINLNYQETLRLIIGYIVAFTLLLVFLLYRHFDALEQAQQKMKLLNKARNQIQQLLTEYDTIKHSKAEIDEKLIKDKDFYLVKFYQDTLAAVKIANQTAPHLVSGQGPAGYTEESLQVLLNQITMKQLCEFLQALQATPRVSVNNLDIIKANVDKKINVSMSLATLKPTVEKVGSIK